MTRHKTRSVTVLPMTDRVWGWLRVQPCGDKVFPYGLDAFERAWKKVRKSLRREGEGDYVPHILRHTCASRLIQRGIPVAEVSKWLGHSNIQTTMRYAHLDAASLHRAARALGRNCDQGAPGVAIEPDRPYAKSDASA